MNDDEDIILNTYNKKNGIKGVASFYPKDKLLKVYEGNSGGSDDKENIDYITFINNYDYHLIHYLDKDIKT